MLFNLYFQLERNQKNGLRIFMDAYYHLCIFFRDKTMVDKLIFIPNDDKQDYNYWLKSLNITSFKQPIKVQ